MNRRFNHVAVLMGGISSERDVSLRSGTAAAKGLRAAGYRVAEVDVRSPELELPKGVEAVFIALHGVFGEDGGVQQALEQRGIPYTGPGVAASRLAFDKCRTKDVLEQNGIPTPRSETVPAGGISRLPLPVVVKPPREGSSVGVTRVERESQRAHALSAVHAMGQEALVEAYIPGRELTVGIVGEQVLPVVEICAPGGAYDYHAKYTAGVTEYRVPAPLNPAETQHCQELAWGVFRSLGARGMGRVDVRWTPEGEAFVLELNTIPGLTETSLLPKAAAAAGMDFPALCERILNLAACDRDVC